jgi:hypothetical protein
VHDSFGEDIAAEVLLKFATAGLFVGNDIIHMDGTPLFIDYSADFDINYYFGHIEKYIGDNPNVIIPAAVDGVQVVQISNGAFTGNENIKTVVIPDGVETIGSLAFAQCTSLESVIMPDSVTEVEYQAFEGTKSLKSIVWAANADVPKNAFSESGIESIVIPDGVKRIGEYAFRDCANLKDVYISNTLEEMGESAFLNCDSIEVVDFLPSSLSTIPDYAFEHCDNVREIYVPEGVTHIGRYAFNRCGDREGADFEGLGANFNYFANEDEIKEMGDNVIEDDSLPLFLTVYLSSTLEYVGPLVFSQTRLGTLHLPKGVTEPSHLPEFDNSFEGAYWVGVIQVETSVTDEQMDVLDDHFESIGTNRHVVNLEGYRPVYVREWPS